MARDAVLQVRMDSTLKQEAEQLYRQMGTTFSEAVRVFAQQSVMQQRLPFDVAADAASPGLRETRGKDSGEQRESGFGMFAQYADENKRALEKMAWQEASVKKHSSKKSSK